MTQSKYTEINQYDCMRDNDTCFLLMKWTSKNSSYPKINKKVVLLQLPKKMTAFVQMSLISPQKWQNTWSCFYLRSFFFFFTHVLFFESLQNIHIFIFSKWRLLLLCHYVFSQYLICSSSERSHSIQHFPIYLKGFVLLALFISCLWHKCLCQSAVYN